MKHSHLAVPALLAAAALVLSGCSGSTGTPSDGGDGSSAITVAVTDPALIIPGRQTVAYDINMAVWAPLTFVGSDGDIEYIAAESIDTEDSQTYTITLRDGWTFQDGTPVTAQDYVDSWNAVAYGPNAFENSGQLAKITGYADVTSETPATAMSGLAVVDDLTFTVTLIGPDSQFPMQVSQAQTAMYPMPASALEDFDAYNTHPIGNGAFEFTEDYQEGEPITLTAYADYKGEKPTVDEITFVPYTDTSTAYNDVLAGNLDVASLPASKMTQADSDFGADNVYSFEAPGISFLGIPLSDPRYQDIRVRQAISMAIDRATINDVIYGGLYAPATAFTPDIEPGTPVGICGEYCEYDPDAAKALLTEAGGFDGTIEIYYPGGVGLDDFYAAIANSIRQALGVESIATPSADWAEFYENRLKGATPGPYFSRWGALYPSQQATLRAMFIENGGCAGCVGEYDAQVATLMDAADAALSDDEVAATYTAVQERLMETFPVPPLFNESYAYVTSKRVATLNTSAAGNPNYSMTVLAGNE
ncbi:ABC transporter substrate-binding protein [Microbacterium oxydans]|uniref:Periplasmic oligopeptide-binding protein n=1 Tax=Microbacterium oxydans TaxID=82380 RepID=A0A0F0L8L6_9MICO|nr:ABC transporter substrate-binding protein [Microbacterium oxydans]KJL28645.1 Periplasmic oligopeptide-binding protein precursor [Microbacterium oxydans]